MTVNIRLNTNELKYVFGELYKKAGIEEEVAYRIVPFCFGEPINDNERDVAEKQLYRRRLLRPVLRDIQLDINVRVAANSVLAASRYMEISKGATVIRAFIASGYISVFESAGDDYIISVNDGIESAIDYVIAKLDVSNIGSLPFIQKPNQEPPDIDDEDRNDLSSPAILSISLFNFDRRMMWISQVSRRSKGGLWLTGGENPDKRRLCVISPDLLPEVIKDVFRYSLNNLPLLREQN